jgi:hypothetical protein
MGEKRYSSTFFDLGIDGGEWSSTCPCRFAPREKSSWYPLDRRIVGLALSDIEPD